MTNRHNDDKKKHRSVPPKHGATSGKTDPLLHNLENFVVEEIELTDTAPPPVQRQAMNPSRWWPALRIVLGATGLWLMVVLASIATRSAWPTDETRWLAIAWEMWTRSDLLVPRLNGATVSVGPLFFWLVHLGWLAFGVVEWWARLVPALFMFGSLFLAARMARFLWPGQGDAARYVPLALLGGFYWVFSATLLSADLLTVFFTLFALSTVLWMWRTRDQRVWLLLGPVLGLGLLASGSLIFLYVLPVTLLAPLWARGTPTMPWKYWYIDIAKAVFVGLAIYAAWAVPASAGAGVAGVLGPLLAPLNAHTLDLFAGARPWWWYLFLLPGLAFPWVLWPLPWMRFWHIRREPISNGLAFCMLWAVSVIVLFSFFEVKQPQFLLPVMPAFFLVANWLLLDQEHAAHDHSRLASTMIFPIMLLGGLFAILPGLPRVPYLPEFLWQLSPFVGVGIIGVGVAVGWLPLPGIEARIANMAVTVAVITALVLLVGGWQFSTHYELSGAARVLATAQQQGSAVAHVGAYSGQYHFAGRLTKPLEVLAPGQLELWAVGHPDGLVVTYTDAWQPRWVPGTAPFYEQPYGDTQLRIWLAAALKGGY
jgi:4-amino-4-deoxy-L-arabinose transferase-like glycosyltransferase